MVVGMKMTVFWVVAPCSLVEIYQCFRNLSASIIRVMSTGKFLPDYMALQPRR
jgi:hypothetical protein